MNSSPSWEGSLDHEQKDKGRTGSRRISNSEEAPILEHFGLEPRMTHLMPGFLSESSVLWHLEECYECRLIRRMIA